MLKTKKADRANRLKRESRYQIARKGYMPANGFSQTDTHTHTHTGLCGGVMGRKLSELDLLQVAESQVCVCKWKGGCLMNESHVCVLKYTFFFSEHSREPRWPSSHTHTHIESVFRMDRTRRREGSEEMKKRWSLLLLNRGRRMRRGRCSTRRPTCLLLGSPSSPGKRPNPNCLFPFTCAMQFIKKR